MGIPLFVSLDTIVPSLVGERDIITKIVQQEYKSKTFADLLQYMIKTEPDALNPQQYDQGQMVIVNFVKGLLEREGLQPGTIRLSAYTKEGYPAHMIPLGLDNVVCDYNDKILKTKSIELEAGERLVYKALELAITSSTIS